MLIRLIKIVVGYGLVCASLSFAFSETAGREIPRASQTKRAVDTIRTRGFQFFDLPNPLSIQMIFFFTMLQNFPKPATLCYATLSPKPSAKRTKGQKRDHLRLEPFFLLSSSAT